MSLSICRQEGLMSSSPLVTPSDSMSARALRSVASLVANPGMVWASTLPRGNPRRSIVLVATISAWVESSPPETPITTLPRPVALRRQPMYLDVVRFKTSRIPRGQTAGHVGKTFGGPAQRNRAFGNFKLQRYMADRAHPLAVLAGAVVESVHSHPLLHEAVQIDVCSNKLLLGCEAL